MAFFCKEVLDHKRWYMAGHWQYNQVPPTKLCVCVGGCFVVVVDPRVSENEMFAKRFSKSWLQRFHLFR